MARSSERGRRGMPLYVRVLIGVALGIVFGLTFGTGPIVLGIENKDLSEVGLLVIKLLKALAAPLILFAILDAFARTRIQARAGGRLILICLVNVSVAMAIGLTILNTLRPGELWRGHLDEMKTAVHAKNQVARRSEDPDAPKSATLNIKENIKYYIPSSLVKPLVYNNVIGIVLVGLLAGAALRRVKDRQEAAGETSIRSVESFVEGVYLMFIQMLEWVVQAVPLAVFGAVAYEVGSKGIGIFSVLAVFLGTCLLGLAIHSLVYYPFIAWFWGRMPPRKYLGMGTEAIVTGLSTNSSLATVPVTLKCLDRMGVSLPSARLAACVGTNLNNDGITLYEAMAALFLAQAVGMQLGLGQQVVVVVASIMAGAGVAGIPEAGLIVLPLVLTAAGLPDALIAAAIPLIVPVDWIIARARSGVNVMSDMLVAILLDRGVRGLHAEPELSDPSGECQAEELALPAP
jgi:Na+/H+-dicarboxylate symporter